MKAIVGIITAFVLALLSGHSSVAQGKFSLSVSGAPTYSYSKVRQTVLTPAIGSGFIPVDLTSRSTGQGYTIGLLGSYAFQPEWSVSAGILMSYNHTDVPIVETSMPVDHSLVGRTRSRHYQVPILVNFQSSTRRLSPYFSAGALLRFRSPTYLNIGNDQEIRLAADRHSVTVVPTIGVGGIYRMTKHLSLAVQPTFNYYLPQGMYSSYFSGWAGLQTQLFYKF